MNLHRLLLERAASGNPLRVALIGAGKFGSMSLSQARRAPAVAKRDLAAGETLDGEGGYTVHGKRMTAEDSLRIGGLPIGLAHGLKVTRGIMQGEALSWREVEGRGNDTAVVIRREMERAFAMPR